MVVNEIALFWLLVVAGAVLAFIGVVLIEWSVVLPHLPRPIRRRLPRRAGAVVPIPPSTAAAALPGSGLAPFLGGGLDALEGAVGELRASVGRAFPHLETEWRYVRIERSLADLRASVEAALLIVPAKPAAALGGHAPHASGAVGLAPRNGTDGSTG